MDGAALGTSAALALFFVPIVSFIKKPTWSHQAKYLLGMVAALICAVVGAFSDGDVKNVGDFMAYFGTAVTSSQVLYNLYFKDTDLNASLEG